MKKFLSILLAASILVGCSAVMTSCNSSKKAFETDADGNVIVKIGFIGPLTGDYASYGNSTKNGAEIAVEELNASGKYPGIKFELLAEDSQGDNTKATSAFGTLLDKGMNVCLGGTLSGETAQVVATSVESGMLVLTPTGSAKDCIGESNAFRICFNDPQQGEAAAQAIKDNNMATKVALFYDNGSDYSTGNIDTFKKKAATLGIEIVSEQTFTSSTNTDFSTQITAIKNSGAELVFMPIYYAEAARFLNQASKLETIFFGVDGLDGLIGECGEENKSDCEDVILLTPFYADAAEGVTKVFVDAYKAKFNAIPDQFGADGYDGVFTIAAAIAAAGYNADNLANVTADEFNEKVIKAMTTIEVVGATGTMRWTADGETVKIPQVLQIKDGKYIVYSTK